MSSKVPDSRELAQLVGTLLCFTVLGCGTQPVCQTYEASYRVTGRLLRGSVPLVGVPVEVTLEDESGPLGDAATVITDDSGIMISPLDLLDTTQPNQVVTHTADDCIVYLVLQETILLGFPKPFEPPDPLPLPSQAVLTLEMDGEMVHLTNEVSEEMIIGAATTERGVHSTWVSSPFPNSPPRACGSGVSRLDRVVFRPNAIAEFLVLAGLLL